MDGLIQIITNVWEEGFLGIGITEIIVSLLFLLHLTTLVPPRFHHS